MLVITCYRKGFLREVVKIFTWHRYEDSPFVECGLNVLTTYDRIEVCASGEEFDLLLSCIPLPRNTPMTTSRYITFFGEQALFIAYNFPYEQWNNE